MEMPESSQLTEPNVPLLGPDARQWRRFRGLELHRQGWTNKSIAVALGVTAGAVSQWIGRVRKEGEQALQHRKGGGPKPKLSQEQWLQLLSLLPQGAEAFGFIGQAWTLPRIAILIRRQFGVPYHPHSLGRVLHSLGWSVQKPETQYAEQNPEKVEQFRRDWTEQKKGQIQRED